MELAYKDESAAKKQNVLMLELKLDVWKKWRQPRKDRRDLGQHEVKVRNMNVKNKLSRFNRILIEYKWVVQEIGDPGMLTLRPLELHTYTATGI